MLVVQQEKSDRVKKISGLSLLLIAFILYSGSSILSKYTSLHTFLSIPYLIGFCGVGICLGGYAVICQKVLTVMSLSKAYLFKSITILLILAFSSLLFGEQITGNNIIGAALIVSGLGVLAWKG